MMADPARRSAAGVSPGWGDARRAVIAAAEACAAAVTRGGDARDAVAVLRELAARLRPMEFGEAAVEAQAERRAAEILAAAGPVPAPRSPRLHVVR